MMHIGASNANGILIHLNYKMLSTFSVIALSVYMFVDTQRGFVCLHLQRLRIALSLCFFGKP